jgi:hypothetical protein
LIIPPSVLGTRNISNRRFRENQNTHFMFSNFMFQKSCSLGNNVEKCGGVRQGTYENITQLMRFACWKNKVRDTHSYRGSDKPLPRPGRKQATATEDFEFHISYL